MAKRGLGFTILIWAEVIVALRILLFSVPVLIGRSANDVAHPGAIAANQFIAFLTIAAAIFFLSGLIAVLNLSSGKLIQFLGVLLVCALSGAFFKVYLTLGYPIYYHYFIPPAFAGVILLGVIFLKAT